MVLEPFGEEEIRSWLAHWGLSQENQEIAYEELDEYDLIDIAQTPVLLYLIRAKIYGWFFDKTAATGGLVEPNTPHKHPMGKAYRQLLQKIAWEFFCHPQSQNGVMLHYEVLLAQLKTNKSLETTVATLNLSTSPSGSI